MAAHLEAEDGEINPWKAEPPVNIQEFQGPVDQNRDMDR
jgi:hypothetical protein